MELAIKIKLRYIRWCGLIPKKEIALHTMRMDENWNLVYHDGLINDTYERIRGLT